MPSFRNILSTSLLLALLSPVIAQTPDQLTKDQEAESDVESFQKLLDQVNAPSLHAALHDYSPKKFKHGMFQEDRNAVKAIHVTEPKAAHSIIELAKRQDQGGSNGTSPISTPAQASTPAPASTSDDHVATPVPPIAPGSTLVPASSSSSVEATSSAPPTSSETESTSAPSVTPTTSFESSSTPTTTSSSASSSFTNGQVITATDAAGDVIISTIGGGVKTITPSASSSSSSSTPHSSITSTAVRTSTLPDGSQSTITAVTVIPAGNGGAPTPAGNAGASGSKTGSAPGLQTGEAVMSRGLGREGMAVLVGALGVAALM